MVLSVTLNGVPLAVLRQQIYREPGTPGSRLGIRVISDVPGDLRVLIRPALWKRTWIPVAAVIIATLVGVLLLDYRALGPGVLILLAILMFVVASPRCELAVLAGSIIAPYATPRSSSRAPSTQRTPRKTFPIGEVHDVSCRREVFSLTYELHVTDQFGERTALALALSREQAIILRDLLRNQIHR